MDLLIKIFIYVLSATCYTSYDGFKKNYWLYYVHCRNKY